MPKREMEVLTPQMYYVLLVLHQPMHGYEIMGEITRITNGEITVGAGSLDVYKRQLLLLTNMKVDGTKEEKVFLFQTVPVII